MEEKQIIDPSELQRETSKEEKPKKAKKKNSKLKYIIYMVFVFVVTAVAVVLSVGDKADIVFSQLKNADVMWLIITFGVMFGTILLRAFILFVFARLYTRNYKYHQALAVEQIGVFYSAVTPGATGGQFMEAYTFQKQGVPVSSAVSMLAMYSIVYQFVLSAYGIVSFAVKYNMLSSIGAITLDLGFAKLNLSIWALTIIGFLLNVGVGLLFFLMSYWKGFHNFIMGPCVTLCDKLHIVKDADKTRENLRVQVENFKIELRRLLTNVPFTLLTIVMFFLLLTFRFSLPYFAGMSLGNEVHAANNFWDAVLLSNYHQMVTGLIPLPGSAGVSEYFFQQLFVTVDVNNIEAAAYNSFFLITKDASGNALSPQEIQTQSSALCSAALLLWRSVSFTIPLIVSGLVTAFYRTNGGDKAGKLTNDMPDRQTMIDITRETLVERANEVEGMGHTGSLNKDVISKKLNVTHKNDEKIVDHSHDDDDYTEIDI